MKKRDLYNKSLKELEEIYKKSKEQLMLLYSTSLTGEDAAKKKGKIKSIKKTIARIKSKLNNKIE